MSEEIYSGIIGAITDESLGNSLEKKKTLRKFVNELIGKSLEEFFEESL